MRGSIHLASAAPLALDKEMEIILLKTGIYSLEVLISCGYGVLHILPDDVVEILHVCGILYLWCAKNAVVEVEIECNGIILAKHHNIISITCNDAVLHFQFR